MLKNILTPALLALTLTGTAFAGEYSNDSQLAAAAGVAAGQYTAAELQNIIEARKEGDLARLNFYLSGTNRTAADTVGNDAGGQLAKIAGVEPGKYTPSELANIIDARKDGDAERLAYYLSLTNRTPAQPAEAVTQGEAQLAALLGVDPAKYTLAELSLMKMKADD